MSKKPKRELVNPGAPRPPVGPACLSCLYRKSSNQTLREYAETGLTQADFNGHLFTGATDVNQNHFLLISQFDHGRQNGLVIVPIDSLDVFMEQAERTAINYLALLDANTAEQAAQDAEATAPADEEEAEREGPWPVDEGEVAE